MWRSHGRSFLTYPRTSKMTSLKSYDGFDHWNQEALKLHLDSPLFFFSSHLVQQGHSVLQLGDMLYYWSWEWIKCLGNDIEFLLSLCLWNSRSLVRVCDIIFYLEYWGYLLQGFTHLILECLKFPFLLFHNFPLHFELSHWNVQF